MAQSISQDQIYYLKVLTRDESIVLQSFHLMDDRSRVKSRALSVLQRFPAEPGEVCTYTVGIENLADIKGLGINEIWAHARAGIAQYGIGYSKSLEEVLSLFADQDHPPEQVKSPLRQGIPEQKEKAVLILGPFDASTTAIRRSSSRIIERYITEFRERGYEPFTLGSFQDQSDETIREKLQVAVDHSCFAVAFDYEASGHLMEVESLLWQGFPVIVLHEGRYSTRLIETERETNRFVKLGNIPMPAFFKRLDDIVKKF